MQHEKQPDNTPMVRLIVALESLDTIKAHIGELMVKAFPVGSAVHWTHGDYNRIGTVLDHQKWCHSVKVKGATGAEYWIDLRSLIP